MAINHWHNRMTTACDACRPTIHDGNNREVDELILYVRYTGQSSVALGTVQFDVSTDGH